MFCVHSVARITELPLTLKVFQLLKPIGGVLLRPGTNKAEEGIAMYTYSETTKINMLVNVRFGFCDTLWFIALFNARCCIRMIILAIALIRVYVHVSMCEGR